MKIQTLLAAGVFLINPYLFPQYESNDSLILKPSFKSNKYGYVDQHGNLIIPYSWESAEPFCNGVALVGSSQDNTESMKYGMIDKTGALIIPVDYEQINKLKNGFYVSYLPTDEIDYSTPEHFRKYEAVLYNQYGKKLSDVYNDIGEFCEGFSCVLLGFISYNQGKYGFIDEQGKLVIPVKYDRADDFKKGRAKVRKDGKTFVINTKDEIISPGYDQLGDFEYNHAIATITLDKNLVDKEGNEFKSGFSYSFLVDTNFNQVTSCYDEINDFYHRMAKVKRNGACGIVNAEGKEIIPPVYKHIEILRSGRANIDKYTGESAFFDDSGKQLTPWFESVGPFAGADITWAKSEGKYGYITQDGDVVIPIIYDDASKYDTYYRTATVVGGDRLLFVTNSGDTAYLRYTERFEFYDGAAIVALHYRVNEYYYVIDSSGNILYKCPYEFSGVYGNGLAPVKSPDNYKYGYIDKYGRVKIDFTFEDAESFFEGLANVEIEKGKHGFINTDGNVVFHHNYNTCRGFYEGLAAVSKTTYPAKFGYINKDNLLVIDHLFNTAGDFSEGRAWVKLNSYDKEYGYIDKKGDLAIPYKYVEVSDFEYGTAFVRLDWGNTWGLIDKNGTPLTEFIYEKVWPFSDGLALVRNKSWGKGYGFINYKGVEVIPAELSYARSFHDGLAAFRKDGKWGFMDRSGNTVIETVFNYCSDFIFGKAKVRDKNKEVYFIDKSGHRID